MMPGRPRNSRPRSAATASRPTAAWCCIRSAPAMWATRFWWMLQSLGFDGASVLDGGLDKWKAEGRAARDRTGRRLSAGDVCGETEGGPFHRQGRRARRERRPTTPSSSMRWVRNSTRASSRAATAGRGAFPAASTCRRRHCSIPRRKTFVPLGGRRAKIREHKASRKDKRVIAYCGGGISATVDLFQLHRLGYDNLTLYDGSMGEWAKDDVAADRDGLGSAFRSCAACPGASTSFTALRRRSRMAASTSPCVAVDPETQRSRSGATSAPAYFAAG